MLAARLLAAYLGRHLALAELAHLGAELIELAVMGDRANEHGLRLPSRSPQYGRAERRPSSDCCAQLAAVRSASSPSPGSSRRARSASPTARTRRGSAGCR